MEHVERQEERTLGGSAAGGTGEQELRGDADELEEQADRMDEGTTELQQKVDSVREEFEAKQDSSDAPGIQPAEGAPKARPEEDE